MVAALATALGDDDELTLFAPGRGPLPLSDEWVETVRHRAPSQVLFGLGALVGRPRLERLVPSDVLWIPAPAPLAIGSDTPYVLTVHDLSWVEHPEWFTRYERLWHRAGRLERLAERASAVIAVSDTTKRAIERHWPRVERIEVVHSGVPPFPAPAPRPEWLPGDYVLAVGALEPRKAPQLLAEAAIDAEVDVVFAGRGRLAPTLRHAPGVHIVEDADRALLATLYDHARALALPSHLEGFGFTALEAASRGTPVLASAGLGAVEETLGDLVQWVPEGEWPAALRTVEARDPEALKARAGTFTWANAAERTLRVLRQAAK